MSEIQKKNSKTKDKHIIAKFINDYCKNLINKLNVNYLVLTANYRRLVLPVLLSNVKEKKIFGTGLFKINKDRTLDHLTISERLMKYTNKLNLKSKINNFYFFYANANWLGIFRVHVLLSYTLVYKFSD